MDYGHCRLETLGITEGTREDRTRETRLITRVQSGPG